MSNYMNIVNFIKDIDYKLKDNQYCNGVDLQTDVYKISEFVWKDVYKTDKPDLNNMCKIHEYLIDEVCKIHKSEENCFNNKRLKENLNIKKINNQIKDGKRASNIYLFNNYDYDYYFIGDLHSDDFSLKRIISQCSFFDNIIKENKIRLIFLGDYVDRGKSHFKLLENILILKYLFPENIYLLRGNHDGGFIKDEKVKLCVGIGKEENENDYFLMYIYNLSKVNSTFNLKMVAKYLEFFGSLCNIAFINHKYISILGVHGGIPRAKKDDKSFYNYINCISDLTDESIVDNKNKSIVHNMLWSDPHDNQEDLRENSGRFIFTHEQFKEFRNIIGFDVLIRGHEAERDGYKRFFNDRLYTIFSSGMILKDTNNINDVTAYYDVAPKIIRINKNGEIEVISVI
ncbi:metallophosphoesterase family protein [Abyssisolibacter fermentans]|uniref:metallophosphoesterase family protein n=1 Tax=Abyssisolibacter fermentans TaxID=1766203 RepID=UPI000834369C|nr:metallophosphoesterase family protein [Abyssisolibacter fermentans]